MSEEGLDQEIFGKIDALLGKRAGFAGGAAPKEEDFPVLTDVVETEDLQPTPPLAVDALRSEGFASRQAEPAPETGATDAEAELAERIMLSIEAKLTAFLDHRRQSLDALIRRIVREEIAKELGQAPRD